MPPQVDSTIGPAITVRAKVGRVVQKVLPNIDEWQWNRKRDREVVELRRALDYSSRLGGLRSTGAATRPSHVVVVPMEGDSHASWKPAGGNFFFEIAQAAREYAGAEKVTVFSRDPAESVADWHERLIRLLIDSGATHLIAQVEKDPDDFESYTWDVFWPELAQRWDGVFLGVLFDSAYRWITIPARRVARASDRFVLVDICMPMDNSMVKGRPEVGPVNMPVSNLSLSIIDEHTSEMEQEIDVSFIGALYPVRVQLIEDLRSRGVNVAVNPHRPDATSNLEESRANQPTYVDYMAGLKRSRMTINFSISSALNSQQLKTRVLEAASMGCLVLTDDIGRTDQFWKPGEEYGYFSSLEELPSVIEGFLNDPDKLAGAQVAGMKRAREINVSSFWGGIDSVLSRRGLPVIASPATERSD